MPRIAALETADMTTEQRQFHDNIVSGPRGGMRGPFQAWIHSPKFAELAQRLGEYCRFHSVLEVRQSELAILVTARQWTAQFEWFAHAPIAQKGGLSETVIEDLRAQRVPNFAKPDEAAIYNFCTELYRDSRITDATYAEAVGQLGEQGVVDLVGVLGYYALVSMTLNVFEMPLPDGVEPPLSL